MREGVSKMSTIEEETGRGGSEAGLMFGLAFNRGGVDIRVKREPTSPFGNVEEEGSAGELKLSFDIEEEGSASKLTLLCDVEEDGSS